MPALGALPTIDKDGRVYHGDLHSGNILIGDVPVDDMGIPAREPSIRVIDFGTSVFVARNRSIARHWRVVNETFRRLLHPLNINRLAVAPDHSEREGPSSILIRWYQNFLAVIPILLIGAGSEHLRPPDLVFLVVHSGCLDIVVLDRKE